MSHKTKLTCALAIFFVAVLSFAPQAQAALSTISLQADGTTVATNPANGFPFWYQDSNGIALQPCLGLNADGTGPVDPNCIVLDATNNPMTTVGAVAPETFPLESFYYFTEAIAPVNAADPANPVEVRLRIMIEGTFTGATPIDGQQTVFARVNMTAKQAGAFVPNGSYTVTYPFGSFNFTTDTAGDIITASAPFAPNGGNAKVVRAQDGAGTALEFTTLLPATDTNIGPFLSSLSAPAGYLGDAVTAGPITPGPFGDSFSISGTGIATPIVQSNWIVAGKLVDTATPVLTTITISPINLSLPIGFSFPMTATTLDQFGAPIAAVITWSSNDPAVVTIDPVTGVLSALAVGQTTITATDGNISDTTAISVTDPLADIIAPDITILGDNPATVAQDAVYLDAGATALDDVDGDLTAVLTTASTVNTAVPGDYTVTYSVTDAAGNTATAVRAVSVTAVPVIPVLTAITIAPAGPSLTAGGSLSMSATTLDQFGAPITATITWSSSDPAVATIDPATGLLSALTAGQTIVTATDGTISDTTTVTVTATPGDTLAPVITISGNNPETVAQDAVYLDAGATALDDVDGDLTAVLTTASTVNTAVPGDYTVTYSVTDAAGNTATAVRAVSVTAVPVVTPTPTPVVTPTPTPTPVVTPTPTPTPTPVVTPTPTPTPTPVVTPTPTPTPTPIVTPTPTSTPAITPTPTPVPTETPTSTPTATPTSNSSGSHSGSGSIGTRQVDRQGEQERKIDLFTQDLRLAHRGDDVAKLQNRLRDEGVFNGQATGFYGATTKQAVTEYQRRHGLATTGALDTLTRAELNKTAQPGASNSGRGNSNELLKRLIVLIIEILKQRRA